MRLRKKKTWAFKLLQFRVIRLINSNTKNRTTRPKEWNNYSFNALLDHTNSNSHPRKKPFLFLRFHCRYFPFDHHSLLNFLIPDSAASFMHNVLVWTMRFNLFLICFFLALFWGLNPDDWESEGEEKYRF